MPSCRTNDPCKRKPTGTHAYSGRNGRGQTFTRPADFNAETYVKKAFGIVGGEESIKVRLLFEPKLAVYITERQWHPSQEFHMRPGGRIEMQLETTGRKELGGGSCPGCRM